LDYVIETGSGDSLEALVSAFSTAKRVFVSTYHVGNLVRALKTCPEGCQVEVFTNIPNRWDSYWGPGPERRARAQIQDYLKRLNPKRYDADIQVYFAFGNHTKAVVVDDDLAYLGSANFGDAKSPNLEAGVLLHEPGEVVALREELRAELLEMPLTFPYVKGSKAVLKFVGDLMELDQSFSEILEKVDDALHDEHVSGVDGEWLRVFRPAADESYTWLVEAIEGWYGHVDDVWSNHRDKVGAWFSGAHAEQADLFDSLMDTAESIAKLPDELAVLAEFNYEDAVMSGYGERHYHEENASRGVELAQGEVEDQFQSIVEELEPVYETWRAQVREDWEPLIAGCLAALKGVAEGAGVDNT